MKVGVISDTHGLLRPEALDALNGAVHILHAGDIGATGIVEALEDIAPVTAIRGNIDTGEVAARHGDTVTVELAGIRIHMVHDVRDLALDPRAEGIAVVVSGHSHKPSVTHKDGVLFLNPGSAGRRRFRLPVTVALLDLSGERPEARIVDLMEG